MIIVYCSNVEVKGRNNIAQLEIYNQTLLDSVGTVALEYRKDEQCEQQYR